MDIMRNITKCLFCFAIGIAAVSFPGGCAPQDVNSSTSPKPIASSKNFPALPAGKEIEKGVMFHEIKLDMGGGAEKIWVYLPKINSQKPVKKLPCVLIGPAGTRLFHGMDLGDGDRPEHLPYVKAGFAVVAYELSGAIPESSTDAQLIAGAKNFYTAQAGVLNARTALDYIAQRVPQIDSQRIYSAGHSSAGTLSLLVAESEPRIQACIAYAPIADLSGHLGKDAVNELTRLVAPDYRDFIKRSSPLDNVEKLKVPVFLFHAADDGNVKSSAIEPFVTKLKTTNLQVTFVRVQSGGHYESMIDAGVPQAIKWLQELDAQKTAEKA